MPDGILKIGDALLDYEQRLKKAADEIEIAEDTLATIKEKVAGETVYQGISLDILLEYIAEQEQNMAVLRTQYHFASSYAKVVYDSMNTTDSAQASEISEK